MLQLNTNTREYTFWNGRKLTNLISEIENIWVREILFLNNPEFNIYKIIKYPWTVNNFKLLIIG